MNIEAPKMPAGPQIEELGRLVIEKGQIKARIAELRGEAEGESVHDGLMEVWGEVNNVRSLAWAGEQLANEPNAPKLDERDIREHLSNIFEVIGRLATETRDMLNELEPKCR